MLQMRMIGKCVKWLSSPPVSLPEESTVKGLLSFQMFPQPYTLTKMKSYVLFCNCFGFSLPFFQDSSFLTLFFFISMCSIHLVFKRCQSLVYNSINFHTSISTHGTITQVKIIKHFQNPDVLSCPFPVNSPSRDTIVAAFTKRFVWLVLELHISRIL